MKVIMLCLSEMPFKQTCFVNVTYVIVYVSWRQFIKKWFMNKFIFGIIFSNFYKVYKSHKIFTYLT